MQSVDGAAVDGVDVRWPKMESTPTLLCKLAIILIVLIGLVSGQEDPNSVAAVQPSDNDVTESEETTDVPPVPPVILTPSSQFMVETGKRLELPCHIQNPESGVLIWKHEAKILATGSTLTSKRNKKLEGTNLILTRVNDADAGNYTCQVAGEVQVEVVHSVTIIRPPTVDIQPGDKEISGEKGQPLPLTCRVQGFPQPSLQWVFIDMSGHRRNMAEFTNQTEIKVQAENGLSKADVGDYYCVANNNIGAPVNNSVRVTIRYKPEVLDGTAVFLSKVGGEAKLECSFSAYPIEGHQLTWHRVVAGSHAEHEADASAKEEVTNDERHEIATDATENKLTSTLLIRNVQETDFQKYICTAQNELGDASHELELSGLAYALGMQTATAHHNQAGSSKLGLSWSVKSSSPVKEYRIIYREVNETHEGEAKNITITEDGKEFHADTENGGVKVYEKTYVFDDLRPLRNYSVVMMAHNDQGWSREAQHRIFMQDARTAALNGKNGKSSSSGLVDGSHRPLAFFSSVLVLLCCRRWLLPQCL